MGLTHCEDPVVFADEAQALRYSEGVELLHGRQTAQVHEQNTLVGTRSAPVALQN